MAIFDLNTMAYGWCIIFTLSSLFGHLLMNSAARRKPNGWTQTNREFRGFQWHFFVAYLPILFADSLQAPYLYYVYQSYGFLESQIAILYVTGFMTNVVCSLLSVALVQRFERRMLCLAFIGINSLSCLMKFSDSYTILLIGRVFDGGAASLLTIPFQQWYVHEHITTFDFPKEWIGATFRRIAIFGGFLAIAAGFIAEFAETTSKITAFPFMVAIPILIGSGFYMAKVWPENRLEPELIPQFWRQWSRAMKVIAQRPIVLLLSAVHALFESCIYMFIFIWTPLFLYARPLMDVKISFGGIYSAFMASALVGTVASRVLSRRFSAGQLLATATAIALFSIAAATLIIYPTETTTVSLASYQVLLTLLCTFELAVGLYLPSMNKLQTELVPTDERAAVVGLFRVPLNLIATVGLLMLHHYGSDRRYGNWLILLMCTVSLMICLLASLLLMALTIRRPPPDLDHFVLQVNAGDDDDEHE